MRSETAGSVVVVFALMLPIALLLIGGSIDFVIASSQRQQLQHVVDGAALAAAREMSMAGSRDATVQSVAAATMRTTSSEEGLHRLAPSMQTTVRSDPPEVIVTARQPAKTFFGNAFGLGEVEIQVEAVARIVGKPNICVLALESSEANAVWLVSKSQMTAKNCSVYSNSTSKSSIAVKDSAMLTASDVCSAGGVEQSGAISPPPYMDCPPFDDPLASRAEPPIGACTFDKTVIDNKVTELKPGVYCGGLRIRGNSVVTLQPGTYIIKDGIFSLADQASLIGDDISIFLDGMTFLFFGKESSVQLSASTSGPLAGLLLFGSRSQSKLFTHTILSKNAHKLVGTIYLPRNSFVVDGEAKVGAESAYTAIVARRLVLLDGPNLVLNSNYDQTNVPVPAGIRGTSHTPTLVK